MDLHFCVYPQSNSCWQKSTKRMRNTRYVNMKPEFLYRKYTFIVWKWLKIFYSKYCPLFRRATHLRSIPRGLTANDLRAVLRTLHITLLVSHLNYKLFINKQFTLRHMWNFWFLNFLKKWTHCLQSNWFIHVLFIS